MRIRQVCILGGTGFIGRHIANRLAQRNIAANILTRRRERNRELLVLPTVQLVEANTYDEDALVNQFNGVDAVINLVGILNESGRNSFRRAHVELPQKIVNACRRAGVPRLLHMSALGADPEHGPSVYQRTKGEGEQMVFREAGPDIAVTSFRPSVVFGPGDSFFNRFAGLLKLSPGLFPLPTPRTRFKPVFVGDVAEAFMRALDERATFGRGYELCGPEVYTLEELVRYTAEAAGLKRRVVGLSKGMSRLQARVLGMLPGKPYTYDNYLSATVDNICTSDGLSELGIHATSIEAVVPGYLSHRNERWRYNQFRRMARRF